MYIDNVGEMTFMNHTTGDRAIINLSERGWNNKVIKIFVNIRE